MKIAIVILEWQNLPAEWTKETVASEINRVLDRQNLRVQFAGIKVFEVKDE